MPVGFAKRVRAAGRKGVLAVFAALFAATVSAACGAGAPALPIARAGGTPTPQAVPTIYRVIDVTPAPTSTPVPLPEGDFYDPADQRPFPPELDNADTKTPLPPDTVTSLWQAYLSGAHIVIKDRGVNLNLCEDGTIIPGDDSQDLRRGAWGLRTSDNDWFNIVLGSQFGSRRRLSGIATLSRNGGRTVAIDKGFALVSVTDSDQCGD